MVYVDEFLSVSYIRTDLWLSWERLPYKKRQILLVLYQNGMVKSTADLSPQI